MLNHQGKEIPKSGFCSSGRFVTHPSDFSSRTLGHRYVQMNSFWEYKKVVPSNMTVNNCFAKVFLEQIFDLQLEFHVSRKPNSHFPSVLK